MTAKTIPIAVLASGRGSNFDAIAQAIDEKKIPARIVCVVSDREAAPVLEKARKRGIATQTVLLKGLSKTEQSAKLLEALKKAPEAPRWIVLAGFMRILEASFLKVFKSEQGYYRVVNIHPALLPSFPGLNSYHQAFVHGCAVTGATVHLVDEEMDHGPICAQAAFSIDRCSSVEEVERLGLAEEHRLYPKTLSWLLTESFDLIRTSEGRLRARPR